MSKIDQCAETNAVVIEPAEQHVPSPSPWHMIGLCPRCGWETEMGYGLAGGGIGPYEYCINATCDWMVKTQDRDADEA